MPADDKIILGCPRTAYEDRHRNGQPQKRRTFRLSKRDRQTIVRIYGKDRGAGPFRGAGDQRSRAVEKQEKKQIGIIPQVAVLFILGVLTTGVITFFTQRTVSNESVQTQMEALAANTAAEVIAAVKEYPGYGFLLRYWSQKYTGMDIEYDVTFSAGTRTEEKARLLAERHPDLQMKYASSTRLQALPKEDQKLYAEVVYSWLTSRLNQIKRAYHCDFLFCVLTEEPYDRQFFLLSAADEGAARGTQYGQVYPLGVEVSVSESQQEAMRYACSHFGHLADAGDYVDYYANLGTIDGKSVLIGLTYDLSAMQAEIKAMTGSGTATAVLHQIFLSALCLTMLFFFVLQPLRKVQKNIRLYKENKDSAAVREDLGAVRARNEIGELSRDVTELTEEIDDYLHRIETITAEKQRIGAELELAARIQANTLPNIFPPFPERREFDLYASMDPAKEVGGDFYDFFMIDEDHLALLIADVSGKGVPAALFMMVSMILIHNAAESGTGPAEVLRRVNEQICARNPEEMFVSVWLGVLEISTGKLVAANAGHEYPALYRPGGSFELLKDKHGFVIGGMAGIRYREYELMLEPGAKLFVYTDGLPEANDAEEKMFGTDRMLAALNREPAAAPKEVLQNVRAAVDAFVQDAEQFDDLTMLCLSYAGPEKTPGPDGPETAASGMDRSEEE